MTRVTYRVGSGAETTASGTTLWTAGPITLSAGSNVITVTAYDAANNAGIASVTVNYSTGGPVGNWYSVLTDPNSKRCDTPLANGAGRGFSVNSTPGGIPIGIGGTVYFIINPTKCAGVSLGLYHHKRGGSRPVTVWMASQVNYS